MAKKQKNLDVEIESTSPADSAPLSRGAGNVRMCCKTLEQEWNFQADSTPDAIEKAKVICAEQGFHWPSDVIFWEITQR